MLPSVAVFGSRRDVSADRVAVLCDLCRVWGVFLGVCGIVVDVYCLSAFPVLVF